MQEYSELDLIEVKYQFFDFDTGQPVNEEKKFTPRSLREELLKIDCPYRECVMGYGFNLNIPIREAMKTNQENIQGEITCKGWQDRERINRHGCYCKMRYSIRLGYKQVKN